MKKLIPFMLLVVVVLVLGGCYEMKQDDKGRTVKINRITGEVSVIDGDKIIKLKDENSVKAEQKAAQKLAEAKTWSKLSLPLMGGTNAALITKWSDGNVYYQFFVDKNLRENANYFASLNILLYDDAEFLVQQIPVRVLSMTGVLGADKKTIESIEYKGQSPMSEETYRRITGWNVTWVSFDKVK